MKNKRLYKVKNHCFLPLFVKWQNITTYISVRMACNFKSFALPVCIQQNIIFYAIDELHGFFSWNTRFLPFPVQHHFTISKIKIYVYHLWINAFHIKLLLSFHKITLSYFPKYTYLECPAKRTNILEFSKQKTAILKYSRNISCKNTSYTFMVYITCIMYWRNIKTSTSWYEHLFSELQESTCDCSFTQHDTYFCIILP